MAEPLSPEAQRLVAKGCERRIATQEKLDNLGDARREASCIGLDVADAQRARDPVKRRQHIADALGRAHQLIHQLKAAEVEFRGNYR